MVTEKTKRKHKVMRHNGHRQGWRCIWCEMPVAIDVDEIDAIIEKEMPQSLRDNISAWKAAHARQSGMWKRLRILFRATLEHLKPRSQGGGWSKANGLVACWWCNNYRGTEDPEKFKARIMALVEHGHHPRQLWRERGHWPDMASWRPRYHVPESSSSPPVTS